MPPQASSDVPKLNRRVVWTVDFSSLSVSSAVSDAPAGPPLELMAPAGSWTAVVPPLTRAEAFERVSSAAAARITAPGGEGADFSAIAAAGGEFGLRAWTLAAVCETVQLTGPAAPMQPEPGSGRRGTGRTGDDPSRIAEDAVSAVASIHEAMATVTGADAGIVQRFIVHALAPAAELYARGGELRRALCDALTFAGAGFSFPWDRVRGQVESLAVLYNFSPFQDTGSTVASKRLRVFAENFDVISCSFLQHKKQDPTVELISRPYVSSKRFLPLTPSWASWPAYRAFAEKAAEVASDRIADGAVYRRLYTRAMWAPSLYAGICIKQVHDGIPWTVEFSDPLSLDVEGAARGGAIPRDDFTTGLIDRWEADFGYMEPGDLTIFRFAELLAYAYADSLIFTNDHQRQVMLSTIRQPRLRERAEGIAVVSHHPTLDAGFYDLAQTDYVVDDDHVHLGYFGEFYTARGITEITDALRALPEHVRSRIRLHVFTNYIPESAGGVKPASFSRPQFDLLVRRTLDGVGVEGVEDRITFNSSLPYLRFLAVSQALDYLVVTDAQSGSGHAVNPYLPSKWSDYRGSAARVWALEESGSVLSGMDPDVRTPIGDSHAARAALWNMVTDKFADELLGDPIDDRPSERGQP